MKTIVSIILVGILSGCSTIGGLLGNELEDEIEDICEYDEGERALFLAALNKELAPNAIIVHCDE